MLGTSEPTNVRCAATTSRRIEINAGTISRADAKTARTSATKGARIGSNIAKTFGITALIGLKKFGTMRGISTTTFSMTPGGAIGVGELSGGPVIILLTPGGGGAIQAGVH